MMPAPAVYVAIASYSALSNALRMSLSLSASGGGFTSAWARRAAVLMVTASAKLAAVAAVRTSICRRLRSLWNIGAFLLAGPTVSYRVSEIRRALRIGSNVPARRENRALAAAGGAACLG